MKALYEVSREAAARAVVKHLGFEGRSGGWIYDPSGRPVCQGYLAFADRLDRIGKRRNRGRAIVPKTVTYRGKTVTRWAINWRAFT